jgi:hypothetical protein
MSTDRTRSAESAAGLYVAVACHVSYHCSHCYDCGDVFAGLGGDEGVEGWGVVG